MWYVVVAALTLTLVVTATQTGNKGVGIRFGVRVSMSIEYRVVHGIWRAYLGPRLPINYRLPMVPSDLRAPLMSDRPEIYFRTAVRGCRSDVICLKLGIFRKFCGKTPVFLLISHTKTYNYNL